MAPTDDLAPAEPGVAPRAGTLAARAQQALLDLAQAKVRQRGESELRAVTAACKIAEQLTAQLLLAKQVRDDLAALGITVGEPRRPDSANSRKNLRSLATHVTDPSKELTDRLSSKSLDEAWEVSRRAARAAENALYEAVDGERNRLRPDDLGSLSVPASSSAALAVSRIRRTFAQPVRERAVEKLADAVEGFRAQAEEWAAIRAVVEDAMTKLHPEVQTFLEAAVSELGAPWPLVTEAVREWLDQDGNGDGYMTRRANA